MAGSRKPGTQAEVPTGPVLPARTPGTLGKRDQSDPDKMAAPGDTPGPVGLNDGAHFSTLPFFPGFVYGTLEELLFIAPEPAGKPVATPATPKAPPKVPDSISQAGIQMIERFEGFSDTMYNDVAGHCTIGYGYLIHKGKCTGKAASEKPFLKGITQTDAEGLLMQKVQRFEAVVKKAVKVKLNQNQFDALVSFVYNAGPTAFQSSTLLKKLNEGKYADVPAEFRKWVHAGGKTVKGLETRRNEEANLFATAVEAPESAAPAGKIQP